MSRPVDPWWASAAGAEGLDDLDPVEAFRAARRPSEPVDGDGGHGGAAQADPAAPPPRDGHRPELCGICPLCTLARALEDTRPELLAHLTEAARHLAAAARALVEEPPTPPADQGETPTARGAQRAEGDGVERIRLHDDRDPAAPPPAPPGTDGPGGMP